MSNIKYGHHISYVNVLKLLAIYLIIFIPVLLVRYPDIRNELKYFIVVDNMLETKNYFILKYFSELYPDKPPLYFWLLSFIKNHFSNSFMPVAVLVGSTIPSFIMTLFSYSLFAKIKDEKTGFIIALSLCTIPFFIGTSVFLRMDMLMSFFIFMALYYFFNLYYGLTKKSFTKTLLIYIFIVLGMLTKGPVGFMVPVCTILVFLFLENKLRFLKEIYFIQGMLFVIAAMGAWIYAIYQFPEGKDYIALLIGQETVGRIVKSKAHVKPFYYYFTMLPALMYPYVIFLFGSFIYYIKNIKFYKEWEPLEKIGFAWTVLPLIILSCASGKLDIYLLPIFIGMTIMCYSFIFRVKDKRIGSILVKISSVITVIPLILNYFFNKENNFYKKLIFIPVSVIIIFTVVGQCMEIYNQNYTLKPVKNEIITSDNISAYRFPDFLNMSSELQKNISNFTDKNTLEEGLKNKKITVVTKAKYENDLKDINELKFLYKNKAYCVYSN